MYTAVRRVRITECIGKKKKKNSMEHDALVFTSVCV